MLRLNELMVTRTQDPVIYTIQTSTMGSHLFLIFLSPMYCNLAQYLLLLMLVQSPRREISKDNKHHSTVKTAGGSFFPLVVETLGLWTPFTIKTLRTIATRASLYKKLAFKNLIGQLSVKLWAYNFISMTNSNFFIYLIIKLNK